MYQWKKIDLTAGTLLNGSDGEELYQETNSIEIAHAMRKIGIPSLDTVVGA